MTTEIETPIDGDTPADVLAAMHADARELEKKRKLARQEYARILNDPQPGDGAKLAECLATLAPRPDEIVAALNAISGGTLFGGRLQLRAWSASDVADDLAAIRGQSHLLNDIRNLAAGIRRIEAEDSTGWEDDRRERESRAAATRRELQAGRERLRQHRAKNEHAFHLIPLP